MKRREKKFDSEAELCDAFTIWAREQCFVVYPETAGWDMLCVTKDGFQLGVEAKLDLNLKVVAQALKGTRYHRRDIGPDYRAILVPEMRDGIDSLLAAVGISYFVPHSNHRYFYTTKSVPAWTFDRISGYDEMFDWNPAKRCELPQYMPDVPAGVPSPVTLSPWKIGALKVLALLELKGFVTRTDVSNCRNDPRRWCASDGWLTQLGEGRWGAGIAPRFDLQHPSVYAQILSETRDNLSLMLGSAA